MEMPLRTNVRNLLADAAKFQSICDRLWFFDLPVGNLLFQILAFLNVRYMDNPCVCLTWYLFLYKKPNSCWRYSSVGGELSLSMYTDDPGYSLQHVCAWTQKPDWFSGALCNYCILGLTKYHRRMSSCFFSSSQQRIACALCVYPA